MISGPLSYRDLQETGPRWHMQIQNSLWNFSLCQFYVCTCTLFTEKIYIFCWLLSISERFGKMCDREFSKKLWQIMKCNAEKDNLFYCIRKRWCDLYAFLLYPSYLVRALWLVNLAGRTLLHGPLKFKKLLLLKLWRDLSQLKLSFTLNCVLKRVNDLTDFKLTRFAFDLVQKFEAVPHEWESFPNPSGTQ